MTKKLFLCLVFFSISPLVLGFSLYLSGFFTPHRVLGESMVVSTSSQSQLFVALPEENGVIAATVEVDEAIPVVIEDYLRHYRSPLLPYAGKIVEAAETYGVDPRLIVAIAQQESNLGKKTPPGCNNAWGWGIHERGTKCFDDWGQAIETVTRGIAKSYCALGLCQDPCLMMRKYTPKSNGSWCAGVKQFLQELETGRY